MTTAAESGVRARRGTVLVVTADGELERDTAAWLPAEEMAVRAVDGVAAADAACSERAPDVVLVDAQLPGQPLGEMLARLRGAAGGASLVVVCGRDLAGLEEAVENGAVDFLVRPLDRERLRATVTLALRVQVLERENRRLARQLQDLQRGRGLVGCSPPLRRLAGCLSRAGQSDATVLIEGRPGSGKTLAAHVIHASGRRCDRPLVQIEAGTLSEAELEEQLRSENGGTLVLEDVDRLAPGAQSRLVRFLKEQIPDAGRERRARVVATTSARLPEAVARGAFREDLYYRLNVYPVSVPSLQERREDIMLLAAHFLRQSAEETGVPEDGFTPAATVLLETHPWPGNVAQLQNAVFRGHALARGQAVDRVHLLGPSTGLTMDLDVPEEPRGPRGEDDDEEVTERDILPLEQEERRLLGRALRATGGNVRRAAQLLRIGRATLYRKIQLYKLRLH